MKAIWTDGLVEDPCPVAGRKEAIPNDLLESPYEDASFIIAGASRSHCRPECGNSIRQGPDRESAHFLLSAQVPPWARSAKP